MILLRVGEFDSVSCIKCFDREDDKVIFDNIHHMACRSFFLPHPPLPSTIQRSWSRIRDRV